MGVWRPPYYYGRRKHVIKPTDGSSNAKAFALVSKLADCWTDSYKMLFVDAGKMADGQEVGPKLLLLDIEADEPGHRGISTRASVHRCKKWFNPHGGETASRFSPWAMRNYNLHQTL